MSKQSSQHVVENEIPKRTKKRKKKRKDWIIKAKYCGLYKIKRKRWAIWGRYATEKDMERAFENLSNNPRWCENWKFKKCPRSPT